MGDRFLPLALRHGAPADVAERWGRELETRYSEPHRYYHTLRHIEEMLDLLPHADETVLMAVWFHDAIYGGQRNGERSAELARAIRDAGTREHAERAFGVGRASRSLPAGRLAPAWFSRRARRSAPGGRDARRTPIPAIGQSHCTPVAI